MKAAAHRSESILPAESRPSVHIAAAAGTEGSDHRDTQTPAATEPDVAPDGREHLINPLWAINAGMAVFFGLVACLLVLG